MSDSESIKIDTEKGTLTIKIVGKDPLVVIKNDDCSLAADYAKILRAELLISLIEHTQKELSEQHSHLSNTEKATLSKIVKVFERELGGR